MMSVGASSTMEVGTLSEEGKLSTVDLLIPTSLGQILLIIQTYTFYGTN
jgi:hypothetical protein